MKTTDILIDKINRLPIGYIFTYDDFYPEVDKPDALMKALSRLVQEGKFRKLSPGRFYKPRVTNFGELRPDTYQVVKDVLTQNGKITGYLTGYSTYNKFGLTTQVSNIIQIGSNELKKNITRGIYQIRFIKQSNTITKENIPLLRMLDAISKIKEIPDSSVDRSCRILSELIKQLNDSERESLIKLAKKYNPSTRALAGAILENIYGTAASVLLDRSLNPFTEYKCGISENVLPNKAAWNIH